MRAFAAHSPRTLGVTILILIVGTAGCGGPPVEVEQPRPLNCDDGDPCSDDRESFGQCTHTQKNCSDGDACTQDACVGGSCRHAAVDCDDANACTNDRCVGGTCINATIGCDDGDACTTDSCESRTGDCLSVAVTCPNGQECVDGTCVSNPPVADAGVDQTITDADGDWAEPVTLDASASTAPSGTITDFVWSIDDKPIGEGSPLTVVLLRRTNTVTLTVTDNNGLTATDTVAITITPAPPPTTVQLAVSLAVIVSTSAFPVEVATPLSTTYLPSSGTSAQVTLFSSSTVSGVVVLSAANGEVIAPALIRPLDEVTGAVQISAERIALGFVALHPIFAQLDTADRESVFDAAAQHPNTAFMASVITSKLNEAPTILSDEQLVPELYAAIQPILDDVLAKVLPTTLKNLGAKGQVRFAAAPCEPAGNELTFTVEPGNSGTAILANPRNVFYGVEIIGPENERHVELVAPKGGIISYFPPGLTLTHTECIELSNGFHDFYASAYGATLDPSTGAGRSTIANTLYAVTIALELCRVPILFKAELAENATEVIAFASGANVTAVPDWMSDFLSILSTIGNETAPDVIEKLLKATARNWGKIRLFLWESLPDPSPETGVKFSNFTGKLGRLVKKAGKFFKYLDVINQVSETAFFVVDTINGIGEGQLHYCLTNQDGFVTSNCTSSFGAKPSFTWSPATGSIGEVIQFDPSLTILTGGGTSTYEWFFDDFDGFNFVDLARGGPDVVQHAFSQTGLHIVTLRVSADGHSYQVSNYVPVGLFPNVGFETGTPAAWTVETHVWGDTIPGTAASHSAIVQVGSDPIVGAGLTQVWSGRHALRVEDSGSGAYISTASRTFVVPAAGALLKFAWAAVLEDPQHLPEEQPYFDVRVRNEDTATDLYYIHHYSGEPGYPWGAVGNWKYTPWQPVELDLTQAGGQRVTVTAIAADCSRGAHGGYVYLDAFEGQ